MRNSLTLELIHDVLVMLFQIDLFLAKLRNLSGEIDFESSIKQTDYKILITWSFRRNNKTNFHFFMCVAQ